MRSVVNAANFRRQGDNGSGDGISGDEFNNHYQRTSKDVVGEKKRGGILDDDDGGGGGARSEVASRATTTETMTRGEGEEVLGRDERDRERWAKLKRLKQAFQVKRMGKRMGTGTGGADEGGKGRGKEGADEAGRSGGAESAG